MISSNGEKYSGAEGITGDIGTGSFGIPSCAFGIN